MSALITLTLTRFREEVEPNIIDIETKFKEKEEEYLNQNDRLRAKVCSIYHFYATYYLYVPFFGRK